MKTYKSMSTPRKVMKYTAKPPCLYLFCKRQPNKSWIAIAGTSSGGCLAGASDAFSYHGFESVDSFAIQIANHVANQKNFAGYSNNFRIVEVSEKELKKFWYLRSFKQGSYKSVSEFLSTFPDAVIYKKDLLKSKTS